MRTMIILLCTLALAGCTTNIAKGPESPYYKVPPGSVIRLAERIRIPPNRTRIWIQGGRVVGPGFNSFEPSCNVEVRRLVETGDQFVEPGEFRVTRTQFLREAIVSSGRLMVASAGPLRLAEAQDSGGDEFFYEGYHLWVENPSQPDVRRFTCRGLYGFPYETRPPSIAEIRAALGSVASLELPGEGS